MHLYRPKDSVTGGNLLKGFESDVLNAGLSSSHEIQVLRPQMALSILGTLLASPLGGASHRHACLPPPSLPTTAQLNVPGYRIPPLSPFSLLLYSFSFFLFSPDQLSQFSSSFLCQPLPCLSSQLGGGLPPPPCSGGLCLLHHSLLKTNNNRKFKKRKYLPVLTRLALMKLCSGAFGLN